MNGDQKRHFTLVCNHEEATKECLKFSLVSMAFFLVITGIAFLMHTKDFLLLSTLLLGILFLLRIRGFFFMRKYELEMAQRILEGVKLEKNQPHLDKFFHKCLERFNFFGVVLTMAKRAFPDVIIFVLFTFVLFGLIHRLYPDFSFSLKSSYPILPILGYFIGDMYYKPLVPLMRAQREEFA